MITRGTSGFCFLCIYFHVFFRLTFGRENFLNGGVFAPTNKLLVRLSRPKRGAGARLTQIDAAGPLVEAGLLLVYGARQAGGGGVRIHNVW